MEKAKRIPYGVSNFVDVVERNLYYVDKTMYLPLLEDQPDSLFFIRPHLCRETIKCFFSTSLGQTREAGRWKRISTGIVVRC